MVVTSSRLSDKSSSPPASVERKDRWHNRLVAIVARNEAKIRNDLGYTLMETVVAMGVFLGVLIPLGVLIGNLLLDRSSELTRRALLEAQSLMTTTIVTADFTDAVVESVAGLQLERVVRNAMETAEIRILVFKGSERRDTLVCLARTVVRESVSMQPGGP